MDLVIGALDYSVPSARRLSRERCVQILLCLRSATATRENDERKLAERMLRGV